MSTYTKAESARRNGAKSRGPTTAEGKARSARNAVRHGLLAKRLCLTVENSEAYKELLQTCVDRFQPADDIELRIVERIAWVLWRGDRFAAAETAMYDTEMDIRTAEVDKRFEKIDHIARFALAFKSLADTSKSVHLYLRYETALCREFDRYMKQLLDVRAKFPIAAPEAGEPCDTLTESVPEQKFEAKPSEPKIPNEPGAGEPEAGEPPNRDEKLPNEPTAAPAATPSQAASESSAPGATTSNEKLPNEPKDTEKCCGIMVQGVCGLGRKCPHSTGYQYPKAA